MMTNRYVPNASAPQKRQDKAAEKIHSMEFYHASNREVAALYMHAPAPGGA